MSGIADILRAYAEGKRKQEFGPDYKERALLNQLQVARAQEDASLAPFRRQRAEQGVEQGSLTLDQLRAEVDQARRRRETLARLVSEGKLPEGFDVDAGAAQYMEGKPLREAQVRSAEAGASTAERRLESMPTPEEEAEDRQAERSYRRSLAAYYASRGNAAAAPRTPRYTGRPLDAEVFNAARREAAMMPEVLPEGVKMASDGSFYKTVPGRLWDSREPYHLSIVDLNKIHQATLQRLLAAGFSQDALAKAGLSVAQGTSVDVGSDECQDPEGLGLGCN